MSLRWRDPLRHRRGRRCHLSLRERNRRGGERSLRGRKRLTRDPLRHRRGRRCHLSLRERNRRGGEDRGGRKQLTFGFRDERSPLSIVHRGCRGSCGWSALSRSLWWPPLPSLSLARQGDCGVPKFSGGLHSSATYVRFRSNLYLLRFSSKAVFHMMSPAGDRSGRYVTQPAGYRAFIPSAFPPLDLAVDAEP